MIFAIISGLCWALFDVLRKAAGQTINPYLLTTVFSLFSLPIFLSYWYLIGAKLPIVSYFIPATLSAFLATIGSLCFIKALSIGRISIIIPTLSLTPVIACVLAYTFLSESITYLELVGIAGIVAGSFFLLKGDFTAFKRSNTYTLIVTICWGSCIVIDKYALQFSDHSFHAVYISGCILILCFTLFYKKMNFKVCLSHLKLLTLSSVIFSIAVLSQFYALYDLQPGILEAIKRGIGVLMAVVSGLYLYKENLIFKQVILIIIIFISALLLTFN